MDRGDEPHTPMPRSTEVVVDLRSMGGVVRCTTGEQVSDGRLV